jgi:hypothetical protein
VRFVTVVAVPDVTVHAQTAEARATVYGMPSENARGHEPTYPCAACGVDRPPSGLLFCAACAPAGWQVRQDVTIDMTAQRVSTKSLTGPGGVTASKRRRWAVEYWEYRHDRQQRERRVHYYDRDRDLYVEVCYDTATGAITWGPKREQLSEHHG